MAQGELSISIYSVAGNLVGIMDADALGLSFSTTAPGGPSAATWRLARSILVPYTDLDFPFDVYISDNEGVVFRGTIEKVDGDLQAQSEWIEVTAVNTLASDVDETSQTFVLGTDTATAMSTVRSTLLPSVTLEDIDITGYTLAADLTLTLKNAGDTLNALRQLGDNVGNAVYWFLWPDGVNGAWVFSVRSKPTTPGYFVSIDDFTGHLGFDSRMYANRQRVQYAGGLVATVDDTAEQTRIGRVRTGNLINRSDITNGSDAIAVASVALTQRKVLRVTSESAQISNAAAIRNANGETVSLWRVRAGQCLVIEGPQTEIAGGFSFDRNMMLIVQTKYSMDTHTLELTFEDFDTMLAGILATLL